MLNSGTRATILRNESEPRQPLAGDPVFGELTKQPRRGRCSCDGRGGRPEPDRRGAQRPGYQSHFGTRLHFGLGARDRVDRIEVRWIGGPWTFHRRRPIGGSFVRGRRGTRARKCRPARGLALSKEHQLSAHGLSGLDRPGRWVAFPAQLLRFFGGPVATSSLRPFAAWAGIGACPSLCHRRRWCRTGPPAPCGSPM